MLARSPLQKRILPKTSPKKTEIVHTARTSTSREESPDLPRVRVLEDSNRSPKRKRAPTENESPASSPPSYSSSQAVKRQRVERDVARPTEIPSTPERSPLSERRITPIRIKHEVVDLEEYEPPDEQGEETDDEDEDENEIGDLESRDLVVEQGEEEEQEEEEAEDDLPGRAPSQSLSEPDYYRAKPWNTFKGPRRRLDFDAPDESLDDDENDSSSLRGPEITSTTRGQQDTQALLRETPLLDLSIPEPDKSWDDEDESESLQGLDIVVSIKRERQDTQALLRETPQLDLTVAKPGKGWDDEDGSDSIQGPEIMDTRRQRQDAQALLRETPQVEFTAAEPKDGWDDDDNDSDSLQGPEMPGTRRARQDTQALLRETPQMDFTVAEPDEGWDMQMPPLPSSPPIPVSQAIANEDDIANDPEVMLTEEDLIAKLESWMDAQLESGIDPDALELALKSASNNPDLADIVLECLRKGEGVPEDVRGVWTEEDDECLEAVDARRINRVMEKHGQEALDGRYEFLRLFNEA